MTSQQIKPSNHGHIRRKDRTTADRRMVAARLGKFTASRFGDLMTKGRKKDEIFGGTAISYMMEVAAQKLTGERVQIFGAALDHGNEFEDVAREEYERRTGCEVEELGFCEISDYSGGSPDGKVKDSNKLIEIKCPYNTANHLKNVINQEIDKKYIWQMQGCMLATGATSCDFISFDPRIEAEAFRMVIINVPADNEMQQELVERLAQAKEYLDQILKA